MLFIVIPSVILCAVLVYQYLFCIKAYYIGRSLHEFRELRYEIVSSLAGNVQKGFSINETVEHHQFLLKLNDIIKYLDAFEPQSLNYKSVLSAYSKILTAIPFQYGGKVKECLFLALKSNSFRYPKPTPAILKLPRNTR